MQSLQWRRSSRFAVPNRRMVRPLVPQFTTDRIVKEYTDKFYLTDLISRFNSTSGRATVRWFYLSADGR